MNEFFLKCAGCGEWVDVPDALCVGCGRVRLPEEIEAGRVEAEKRAARQSRLKAGKWILCMAVLGGIAWLGRDVLARGAALVRARLDAASNTDRPISPEAAQLVGMLSTAKHVQPARPVPDSSEAPVSDPGLAKYGAAVAEMNAARTATSAAPAVPEFDPNIGRPAFDPNMGRPDPASMPRSKATPAPVPPEQPGIRTIYGVVYDLATGLTVPSAVVYFQLPFGMPMEVIVDEKGHYRYQLSNGISSSNLTGRAGAPSYGGSVEDGDPPFYERTKKEREDFLEQLAPSDLEPQPVRFRDSDAVVRFDLVLVKPRPAP